MLFYAKIWILLSRFNICKKKWRYFLFLMKEVALLDFKKAPDPSNFMKNITISPFFFLEPLKINAKISPKI